MKGDELVPMDTMAAPDIGGFLSGTQATIQWGDNTLPELVPGASEPQPERPLFQRGQLIEDKYQIRGLLGAGGMGQVYEAHDVKLNRTIAIKVALGGEAVEPLLREAQVLAAFRCPGLPTVHALGKHDGCHFMVMERLKGRTLAEVIALHGDRQLSIEECLSMLDGLCGALAPLHAAGLAHADLKPANVMIAPGDRIVLLDFGIARIEQLRKTGQRISGSPHYMAPEVIRGVVEVGAAHRVDLYALGVIAYVLLTGTPPFEHENPFEIMMMHLNPEAPRVNERRRDVPITLARLVHELLAKDPGERPSDIEAARAELRRAIG
jgi:serine/threonine-protein kinase